jgi:hypothetical protein
LKPPHARREIRLRRFQEQMVVITHQRIRMNPKTRPLANLSQRSQKGFPVFVIENNIPFAITPRQQMIKRPSILDSNLSWHDTSEAQSRGHVKNQFLTPLTLGVNFMFSCRFDSCRKLSFSF